MKNTFTLLRSRGAKVFVASSALVSAAGANAALPTWAAGMGEDLSAAVTDAATMVGPVIALALVSMIVIKMIKRFGNKV